MNALKLSEKPAVHTQTGKVLYTAKTHTTGGRQNGVSRSSDGRLDIKLSPPGTAGTGTNPEQLFAAGWSACFEGAMGLAARKMNVTRPAGRGTLINISSVLALAPERFDGPYSGTKAYLLNLSLRLQQEVAGKGVRVQEVLPGATRTPIWEKAGTDIATFPPSMVMEVDEMVDAALAGIDSGEAVTIPSLPDVADWEAYEAARRKTLPNLSLSSPAKRYGVTALRPTGVK